ncbi:Ultraviolet-B receptor UVR8 [Acorus calamus]|uniref:Ultraviolet-B receptor UVR8 n=1 Tax=Acorus calamus TaxID=4465 RepID=A0AAV9E9G8_ACOCL|nr:Ultraviolet-B receptor UVR8 [Acorus calamus]
MENYTSPSSSFKISARKLSSNNSSKDLWFIAREGSVSELESALSLLKKNGGNIDSKNAVGLTPLHIATWRNHVPIVRRLLAAGADPDARDGESGWSSVHRALHFGHLAVASVLLQYGASLTLEDSKYRTPVDLLSGPVSQVVGNGVDSVSTEVYSWGSGANYQLGTGNPHVKKLPGKVDDLQGCCIKIIAAAKFHSVAVGSGGELYTWGFGRGGRLGHPDFDIHSGQAAVITPRQVMVGLGSRRVKAIAAAKHHTVIAMEGGDVYSWGSNREGQLGYTSKDTQPTPRRVSSLKTKIITVAAANKHSAAVSETGEVFTWGCNKEGQLGYGTSNSASNYTPRVVESLKGKVFREVSAAKYHTIVVGADGEVYTWGHRLVTPKRVVIARNIKKNGSAPLKFHRLEKLHVISVAAGTIHSTALTEDGILFYWVSSDPDLKCQQLYSICGRNFVSISAGKYWTAAVTKTGDVFMWDGKQYREETPILTRLHGVKRATSVSVGETHLLMVCSLYNPIYSKIDEKPVQQKCEVGDDLDELDEELMFNDVQTVTRTTTAQIDGSGDKCVPSLKSLCEKVAAETLVEPKNAIQLLELADTLEANDLKMHCEDVVLRNLDYIIALSVTAITSTSLEILAKLEKSLDMRSSESWSYRRLPTLTATFPAIIDSEEESESANKYLRSYDNSVKPMLEMNDNLRAESFLQTESAADQAISKQTRALRKKLQQIEMLEAKQSRGHLLDDQQIAKLQTRTSLESALAQLGSPSETQANPSLPLGLEGKGNKKTRVNRKQRKKNKEDSAIIEAISVNQEICIEESSTMGVPEEKSLQIPKGKEEGHIDATSKNQFSDTCSTDCPVETSNVKTPRPTLPKKKNKRGGLSLFLSGALDDAPKEVAPPPTPKSEGPAWGGAKVPKGSTSLRDIQSEQSKTKDRLPSPRLKDGAEDFVESGSVGAIRLSSYLPGVVSSPIAMPPSRALPVSDSEKSTPPWALAGTSPISSRPSLKDIQMQQEKRHQSISHSPKTRTSGFAIASSQSSPSEAGGPKDAVPSRWFKPEMEAPSSIRSIQIEERAMKDLKRFYKNVKLVKTQTQLP